MKEITIKEQTIKLKKDYLTNDEVNYMITEALEAYKEPSGIEGYNFNALNMMTNFNALLFSYCIDDYDIGNIDDYNKYYNLGVQTELLMEITNAMEAYNLLNSIAKQMSSISGVIDKGLNSLISVISTKMPEREALEKMMKKLPKEFNKALEDYNNIIGNNNENGDK